MSKIRKWVARKLAPEVFENAEKFWWLQTEIQQDYRWLGEFPEIEAYLRRKQDHMTDRYRPLGTMTPYRKYSHEISSFREQLRRGEHLREEPK